MIFMNLKNYCIVVIGDTEGILPEILKISDSKPKKINSVGIFICTFISVADAKELEDYFKSLGRNFFLFEVGANNSGYSINNKDKHDGLFKDMEKNFNDLKSKSDRIMDEIAESLQNSGNTEEDTPVINFKMETKTVKSDTRPNKSYYNNLSISEKETMINEILDKGIDNISDFDKKVLDIISEKK